MNETIQMIAVYALPLLFAVTLHEAAHAFAARYLGDNTAYSQGRMSLNPAKHIDPFGSIFLPLIFILFHSPITLGYAKPVPVDYTKLRNPRRDSVLVALAGPGANFIMALLWAICAMLLYSGGVNEPFFNDVAKAGWEVNLVFLAFNLFPLPPLDGGRILLSLLPIKYAYKFARIEPYGFVILIALLYFRVLNIWIGPLMVGAGFMIKQLLYPLSLLLH